MAAGHRRRDERERGSQRNEGARDERAFLFLGKRIGSADLMTPERKERRRGRVCGPDGLAPVRLRALKLLAAVGLVKIPARSPRVARALDRMGDKE
jgi:hypothetical protein